MATAVSLANYEAALGEVYDDIEAADWDGAERWLLKAYAQLAGLPASSSHGNARIQMRAELNDLREAILDGRARSERTATHSRFIRMRTTHP